MSFIAFLIGTLTVSSLALLALLVSPRPLDGLRADRVPIVSAALAALLVALGFIGGLSIAG